MYSGSSMKIRNSKQFIEIECEPNLFEMVMNKQFIIIVNALNIPLLLLLYVGLASNQFA